MGLAVSEPCDSHSQLSADRRVRLLVSRFLQQHQIDARLIRRSVDFIGRLGREILAITDTKKTIFVNGMNTWYNSQTKVGVLSQRTFTMMFEAVGAYGIVGLDRLYSFMIVRHLQSFSTKYQQNVRDHQINRRK